MTIKRKRMFFDIETSYNVGWFWRPGKQVIRSDQIINERAIICICWKWEGDKKVHHLTWDKNQNDKSMLKKFLKELNKADEIVAHNGDNFDVKWVRTRCIKHKLPVFPEYRTVDTYKLARAGFNFNSSSLNYIAQFLSVGQKMETGGIKLWNDIIQHQQSKALKKMVAYCRQDVVVLEKVYNQLRTYSKHKLHYGVLNGAVRASCPDCASSRIRLSKTYTTTAGTIKRSLACRDCQRKYTVSDSVYQELLDG